MSKTILLAISLLILLSNCKKDCHDNGTCPQEYYRIRLGEVKNYLWTLPGSYWIYKNTVTGDLDTQTCTSFVFDSTKSKGTKNSTQHIKAENDYIKRIIECSYSKLIYLDQTVISSPDAGGFNNGRTFLNRQAINAIGQINPMLYPFQIGVSSGNGSSSTFYNGFDTTLVIQGKIYTNVAKFDIDQDDVWYKSAKYPNATYYWAKDVGLVKRLNKTENFSWELINYKIIK